MKKRWFSKIIVVFCILEMFAIQVWSMRIASHNSFLVTGLLSAMGSDLPDVPYIIERQKCMSVAELESTARIVTEAVVSSYSATERLMLRGIPDALRYNDGSRVNTPEDFERRREEIKEILAKEEYGYIPDKPVKLRAECVETDEKFLAGKAPLKKIILHAECKGGECSFPIYSVVPKKNGPHPAFVHINFRDSVPDRYMPSEELCDLGFAVFSFSYNDVSPDREDGFTEGIAALLSPKKRSSSAPGKIALWAWAAMRVMDYIETLPEIDKENVAVVGHSRLGKTALVTGGYDERFRYVISNDSGCAGAALERGKTGERIPDITENCPRWFCPNYVENAYRFAERGYDQNFLLALSVPRHIMIGSAKEDLWADPTGEFLSLLETNRAYSVYGMEGLVHENLIPKAKSILGEGDALYQIREGVHYFSREDWLAYTDFILRKMGKK